MVVLTNQAPRELLSLAGPSRKAILLNFKPLMITFPDQKGVYQVQPDDIVFENHHTGRDVSEAGSEETSYEKFFASAMKKFGVSSPIDLSPEDTKKFFNYVDKNWEAEEESDGSKTEILPAIGAAAGGVARAAGAGFGAGLASAVTGDENEDVSTGKVGKKDKGSYQHAYKLALKKYQIHSADELDTPAERKGFTAYVDKLWKGGEVKDHALESDMTEAPKKSRAQRDRERKKKIKQQQRSNQMQKKEKEKPTFAQKAKAKASAAGSSIKKKVGQVAADRKEKKISNKADDVRRKEQKAKEQAARQKEREREQAAREKEREQKAKENDDDKDDKEKEKGGFGSFIKQAAGETTKAAKQQAAQYGAK